jgi:hypothetical protein
MKAVPVWETWQMAAAEITTIHELWLPIAKLSRPAGK